MAVVTGELTSVPNLFAKLRTEPTLPTAQALVSSAPASASRLQASPAARLSEGSSNGMARFAGGRSSPFLSPQLIQALPPAVQQAMMQGVNSPQFYTGVGSVKSGVGSAGSGVGIANFAGGLFNSTDWIHKVQAAAAQQQAIQAAAIQQAIQAAALAAQQQILAQQALAVNTDQPSLWFINFPKHMSQQDSDAVQRYRQSMLDFRSWSSGKWWGEVNRRLGNPGDLTARIAQSRAFAEIACEDMVQMSWLRTTKNPYAANHQIDCAASDLHQNIVSQTLAGWTDVDEETVHAIEPLFQDIVQAAQSGVQNSSDLKCVIVEKYVYDSNSGSVTSYIRLYCFQLSEAFYSVVTGKNSSQSRVNLQLNLLQYEAIFEVALWDQYSLTLPSTDKDIFKDFIGKQSIDL